MCSYVFFQCPEGPASDPDVLLKSKPSCLYFRFSGPTSAGGWQADYFVVSASNRHQNRIDELDFDGCEHISPFQEAVGSVYSLPDLILVVLDSPRDIPLAIHNIAQVGVLVGGVDFLTLQGHNSGQLPAYCHNPALGGIHSYFPSVRPFGYGIQCGL
ncbi:hypothetical protein AYI69_g11304 [Smittium culicis]|uniref:Uncharacterized protein n=1 Tax=Smittium culicis TaxID=133412 RepID=A0A1R1WZN1_9FUNG|nr:hypothetical protein AYI69_g11304 [Smittium culicis]